MQTSATARVFAEAKGVDEVAAIIPDRCAMCHAREPVDEGIHRAPMNMLMETEADIVRAARAIYLYSGASRAMPPANMSAMEDAERRLVAAWYRAAQR